MLELERLMRELLTQDHNNSLTGICSISKYPDSIISDLSRMNNHEFDNAFRYLEEIIQKQQQRKQEAAAKYKQATDNATADYTKYAVNKPAEQPKSCIKEEKKKTNSSSPICSSFDEQMRQLQAERKRLEEELELAKLRAENQKLKDQINRYNQSNKFFI
jgi:hypothetical protein